MDEQSILSKIISYGAYFVIGLLGWFIRKHIERADMKEKEQDSMLNALDKRLDSHDVSRAQIKTQIESIHDILKKVDKNIDKLLDKK